MVPRRALALAAVLLFAAGAAAQTAADCARAIPHCSACRYQYYRGTTTKAICTQCTTGYVVRASGRACYCAPGYATADSSVSGFTCDPCGAGNWCPGAKVSAESSTAKTKCGKNKITTTEFGKSERECVVPPGYGWAEGDASDVCAQGSYNPGYNARACSKCPGSLTTLGPMSNSSTDCLAGIGSYYLRGKAVACARATYKSYIGNNDCDKCPDGTTTVDGVVGNDEPKDCQILLPGYSMVASPTLGTTAGVDCPVDTYRVGEKDMSTSTAAIPCTACGNNLVTLPNTTRATTPDACLAPPGYGWDVDSTGANPAGKATICPEGWYNPGYNREKCQYCGDGLKTDGPGAKSSDMCYTPAGWGTSRTAAGVLSATPCPINTFGRTNKTYGLYDVECTKCLDHLHTAGNGSVGASQCLTDPGYGYGDGQALECEYGYYNAGDNQNICTYCGDFKNTTSGTDKTVGVKKATSANQCATDYGYTKGANGTVGCLRGYYKNVIGDDACTMCPAGTTTSIMQAATNTSDCDACRPGFGAATGKVDLSAPSCTICSTGTYSSGYFTGGQTCQKCPQTQNFTGTMVSRPGTTTPEECYGEYLSDPGNDQNFLSWDLLEMASVVGYSKKSTGQSSAECQTACTADAYCQYYTYYGVAGPGGADQECYHLSADTAVVTASQNWDAPSTNVVAFEIKEGKYVVYKKTTGTIGTTLQQNIATRDAAQKACDESTKCVGFSYDGATAWRTFAGSLRESVVSKVRVLGPNIQAWLPLPTGTEAPAL